MNRLANEPSRYLRQHADQPVDWYPWGPDALARAREEDKPLFVSVGYSACHWCHVMAHESFDDPGIAAVLNDRFVAVKVDREERPDVDAVYMEAVQAMNGHGGWPMSVFATPDGRPFFTGTYFPRSDSRGMPGFDRVVAAMADAWSNRRADVEAQADEVARAVARGSTVPSTPIPTTAVWPALLGRAADELVERLDPRFGGFGPAPKFPQPALIELLLQHHRLSGDDRSLAAATTTLAAMAAGGIYDHLAGGFARYATDATWTVPHFEKMLYDQAGLVRAYLHAWQATGDPRWLQVVEETIGYVLGDLTLPDGGLAAARDADSEGEEGRFYVWSAGELRSELGDDYDVVAAWYQVDGTAAFEGRHVLRRPAGDVLARPDAVEAGRRRLLAARDRRVAPGRDDKLITEWNAMFVGALAEAAAATGTTAWAQQAESLGEVLWTRLRRAEDGRLMRTWQAGSARHLGCAADHAWMVDACTRLAELTGRAVWSERATTVAREMLARFSDGSGLLATSGDDADALVVRPVELVDGATPSASSVAATALLRLGALTGDTDLVGAGDAIAGVLASIAASHPLAFANAVMTATLAAGGTTEVVVTDRRHDMVDRVRRRFEPAVVLAWGERTEAPLWMERPDDGRAYVCRHSTCLAPAIDPDELAARLDEQCRHDASLLAAASGSPA